VWVRELPQNIYILWANVQSLFTVAGSHLQAPLDWAFSTLNLRFRALSQYSHSPWAYVQSLFTVTRSDLQALLGRAFSTVNVPFRTFCQYSDTLWASVQSLFTFAGSILKSLTEGDLSALKAQLLPLYQYDTQSDWVKATPILITNLLLSALALAPAGHRIAALRAGVGRNIMRARAVLRWVPFLAVIALFAAIATTLAAPIVRIYIDDLDMPWIFHSFELYGSTIMWGMLWAYGLAEAVLASYLAWTWDDFESSCRRINRHMVDPAAVVGFCFTATNRAACTINTRISTDKSFASLLAYPYLDRGLAIAVLSLILPWIAFSRHFALSRWWMLFTVPFSSTLGYLLSHQPILKNPDVFSLPHDRLISIMVITIVLFWHLCRRIRNAWRDGTLFDNMKHNAGVARQFFRWSRDGMIQNGRLFYRWNAGRMLDNWELLQYLSAPYMRRLRALVRRVARPFIAVHRTFAPLWQEGADAFYSRRIVPAWRSIAPSLHHGGDVNNPLHPKYKGGKRKPAPAPDAPSGPAPADPQRKDAGEEADGSKDTPASSLAAGVKDLLVTAANTDAKKKDTAQAPLAEGSEKSTPPVPATDGKKKRSKPAPITINNKAPAPVDITDGKKPATTPTPSTPSTAASCTSGSILQVTPSRERLPRLMTILQTPGGVEGLSVADTNIVCRMLAEDIDLLENMNTDVKARVYPWLAQQEIFWTRADIGPGHKLAKILTVVKPPWMTAAKRPTESARVQGSASASTVVQGKKQEVKESKRISATASPTVDSAATPSEQKAATVPPVSDSKKTEVASAPVADDKKAVDTHTIPVASPTSSKGLNTQALVPQDNTSIFEGLREDQQVLALKSLLKTPEKLKDLVPGDQRLVSALVVRLPEVTDDMAPAMQTRVKDWALHQVAIIEEAMKSPVTTTTPTIEPQTQTIAQDLKSAIGATTFRRPTELNINDFQLPSPTTQPALDPTGTNVNTKRDVRNRLLGGGSVMASLRRPTAPSAGTGDNGNDDDEDKKKRDDEERKKREEQKKAQEEEEEQRLAIAEAGRLETLRLEALEAQQQADREAGLRAIARFQAREKEEQAKAEAAKLEAERQAAVLARETAAQKAREDKERADAVEAAKLEAERQAALAREAAAQKALEDQQRAEAAEAARIESERNAALAREAAAQKAREDQQRADAAEADRLESERKAALEAEDAAAKTAREEQERNAADSARVPESRAEVQARLRAKREAWIRRKAEEEAQAKTKRVADAAEAESQRQTALNAQAPVPTESQEALFYRLRDAGAKKTEENAPDAKTQAETESQQANWESLRADMDEVARLEEQQKLLEAQEQAARVQEQQRLIQEQEHAARLQEQQMLVQEQEHAARLQDQQRLVQEQGHAAHLEQQKLAQEEERRQAHETQMQLQLGQEQAQEPTAEAEQLSEAAPANGVPDPEDAEMEEVPVDRDFDEGPWTDEDTKNTMEQVIAKFPMPNVPTLETDEDDVSMLETEDLETTQRFIEDCGNAFDDGSNVAMIGAPLKYDPAAYAVTEQAIEQGGHGMDDLTEQMTNGVLGDFGAQTQDSDVFDPSITVPDSTFSMTTAQPQQQLDFSSMTFPNLTGTNDPIGSVNGTGAFNDNSGILEPLDALQGQVDSNATTGPSTSDLLPEITEDWENFFNKPSIEPEPQQIVWDGAPIEDRSVLLSEEQLAAEGRNIKKPKTKRLLEQEEYDRLAAEFMDGSGELLAIPLNPEVAMGGSPEETAAAAEQPVDATVEHGEAMDETGYETDAEAGQPSEAAGKDGMVMEEPQTETSAEVNQPSNVAITTVPGSNGPPTVVTPDPDVELSPVQSVEEIPGYESTGSPYPMGYTNAISAALYSASLPPRYSVGASSTSPRPSYDSPHTAVVGGSPKYIPRSYNRYSPVSPSFNPISPSPSYDNPIIPAAVSPKYKPMSLGLFNNPVTDVGVPGVGVTPSSPSIKYSPPEPSQPKSPSKKSESGIGLLPTSPGFKFNVPTNNRPAGYRMSPTSPLNPFKFNLPTLNNSSVATPTPSVSNQATPNITANSPYTAATSPSHLFGQGAIPSNLFGETALPASPFEQTTPPPTQPDASANNSPRKPISARKAAIAGKAKRDAEARKRELEERRLKQERAEAAAEERLRAEQETLRKKSEVMMSGPGWEAQEAYRKNLEAKLAMKKAEEDMSGPEWKASDELAKERETKLQERRRQQLLDNMEDDTDGTIDLPVPVQEPQDDHERTKRRAFGDQRAAVGSGEGRDIKDPEPLKQDEALAPEWDKFMRNQGARNSTLAEEPKVEKKKSSLDEDEVDFGDDDINERW
jgi:hypothetical protein